MQMTRMSTKIKFRWCKCNKNIQIEWTNKKLQQKIECDECKNKISKMGWLKLI